MNDDQLARTILPNMTADHTGANAHQQPTADISALSEHPRKRQYPGRMPEGIGDTGELPTGYPDRRMPFNPSFETAISTARFSTYRSIGRDDDHAWDLYRWNIDLSAALVPLIVDFEVALRNTIHEQLTIHLGRPDWWANDTLVLDDATQRGLMNVIAKHQKHIVKGTTGAGRVIAELMLGTWVCLLGRGGTSSLGRTIDYEANLWRPALRHGFSNGPTRPTRDDVHKRADLVRALRNRSAHHEPIFEGVHRPGAAKHTPKVPLRHIWEQTIELLEWINPALAAHHQTANLLPATIAARPA